MGFDLYARIREIPREARLEGLAQWADGLEDKFSIAMTSSEAYLQARWELEQFVISLGDAEPSLSRHATQVVEEITEAMG